MTLHQNVCAINLAKALYYVRADYYGIAVRDWETLEPRAKHEYVEHAQDVLEALRAVARQRRQADKVVARISPDAPWGIDPRD